MKSSSVLRSVFAVSSLVVGLLVARPAYATCNGPPECCITDAGHVTVPLPEHVRIGLRVLRLNHITERDGSFSGDLVLVGRYPAGGIFPDLTVRNAGESVSVISDTTFRVGDSCYRARRINDTFFSWFRLRRFPFDQQLLRIELEDEDYNPAEVVYENTLWPNAISADAYREIDSWKYTDYPHLRQRASRFSLAPGRPPAHLLIIEIPIKRLWEFYITRYFLPLFLIVGLAYALFWIKPEDLGSASSIGITCVLAIIAFQLTQADSLPRVAYLTLADRVYIVCYLFTAMALAAAVHESYLSWTGRDQLARRLDKRYRVWFPILFFMGSAIAVVTGYNSQRDPNADIPSKLPPLATPPGEADDPPMAHAQRERQS